MSAKFNFKYLGTCLFAVFVDILGLTLALPLLTAIFTTDYILPSTVSDAVRYGYLATGLVLYPCFMFFGSSFMGDLSDIIGRKKVLLSCMGGFTIGFILMGLGAQEANIWLIFLGRALTGTSAASLSTTMAAIADLSTPENKATHMSFVVLAQGIGFVIGPLMGGVLSDPKVLPFFNYATPFYISGFLALLSLLFVTYFFQESFTKKSDKKVHPLRIFYVFLEAAKHRRVRNLTLAFIFHQIGVGLYLQLILVLLHENFQYNGFKMGLFNAFLGFWIGVGIVFIKSLTKRLSIEAIATISIGFIGISVLLTSLASSLIWVWVLSVTFGIATSIAWAAIISSFSNAVDEKSQGWVMGITGAVVALSFIISGFSPNLIPYIGILPLFTIGGIILILGSLTLTCYCRKYIQKKTNT